MGMQTCASSCDNGNDAIHAEEVGTIDVRHCVHRFATSLEYEARVECFSAFFQFCRDGTPKYPVVRLLLRT